MAGDWIKMEVSTPEKSEVLAITAIMGWDDTDLTVGKLFRLWRWFDQQTTDGNAHGVTSALLDRVVGVTGFCDALIEVGWLVVVDRDIYLPKFDRHNGKTAKSRAQTAKRVADHKSKAEGSNAKGNAHSVTSALPREDDREEGKPSTSSSSARGVGRTYPSNGDAKFPMSLEWSPSKHFRSIARQAGVANVPDDRFKELLAEFRAYWFAKSGREQSQHEWDHTLLKNMQANSARQAQDAAKHSAQPVQAGRRISREDARRAAATTRLADLMNDDGTMKIAEPADDKTIECTNNPRILG